MSHVSEMMVREYFESLGFVVSQPCKYLPGRRESAHEDFDLIVCNPVVAGSRIPENMVWQTPAIRKVARAVVAVRGWHTERFYAATFEQSADLLRFASDAAFGEATDRLGSRDVAKILCLSGLPASKDQREKALKVLKKKGVDGVIEFPTILRHLINEVDKNRNYDKSDILQVIRVFKSYDLFKDSQLDFFEKKTKKRRKSRGAKDAPKDEPKDAPKDGPEVPPPDEPKNAADAGAAPGESA